MIQMQPAIDRIGVTGYSGTLKPRGSSGCVCRSTITPIDTTRNATNVPMLVISARKLMGIMPASSAMTTATMIVFGTGVSVRGFTLWNSSGSMPSRDIANRMRVWP